MHHVLELITCSEIDTPLSVSLNTANGLVMKEVLYLLMTPSELHLLQLEVHTRQLTVCISGSKNTKIKPRLLRSN